VRKEKLKHPIRKRPYNTSFYPRDPVANGYNLEKKIASGGVAPWPRKRGLVATFRENCVFVLAAAAYLSTTCLFV
jgi:hypothetical protein